MEELTKSVLDTDPDGGVQLNVVPETLQDALTARLDRLTPARELIQVAALLGRIFEIDIVRAVTGLGADQLESALLDLAEAGLVYRRPRQGREAFEFKHALIQEAALNTLVRRQRALLHARIAEVLPRIRPEIVQHQPEVVAQHLQEAGDDRAALGLWRAAGELAAQRSASAEAAEHLTRATECARRLGMGAIPAEDEAAIYLSLSTALMQAGGYRSDKLACAMEAADRAARATGSLSLQCRVAVETAPVFYGTGRNETYLASVEHLVDHTDQMEPWLQASLLVTRGCGRYNRGEYIEAEKNFRAARDLQPRLTGRPRAGIAGGDVLVVAGSYAARTLRVLGWLQQAHAVAVSTEVLARGLDDPFSLAWGLLARCRESYALGHDDVAMADADQVVAICLRYGFGSRLGNGLQHRGLLHARRGELERGLEDCQQALSIWRRPGVVFTTPEIATDLAELLLRAGRSAEARAVLDDVDSFVSGTDEAAVLAECQRVRGMIAAADGDPSRAEHWLETATATARAQAARFYELRATTRRAELLAAQSRKAEARQRLADVYSCFTEGHDAPDLRAAKALLDRLET